MSMPHPDTIHPDTWTLKGHKMLDGHLIPWFFRFQNGNNLLLADGPLQGAQAETKPTSSPLRVPVPTRNTKLAADVERLRARGVECEVRGNQIHIKHIPAKEQGILKFLSDTETRPPDLPAAVNGVSLFSLHDTFLKDVAELRAGNPECTNCDVNKIRVAWRRKLETLIPDDQPAPPTV